LIRLFEALDKPKEKLVEPLISWITVNGGTLVVGLVVLALVGLAVFSLVRNKQKGKRSGCSCSCACADSCMQNAGVATCSNPSTKSSLKL